MARTCVLHSHMYSIGTIRDDFSICIDVLQEFDFKLVYISMRHKDFEEQFDEVMANAAQFVSSASDLLKTESEDEPWVSSSIDSIIMDAILGRNSENLEAKEEPQWVDELMVESKAEIIAVSSDDEEESMVKSKMEVILIELSDEGSMEETNGEVVQEEPRDVQMSEGAKELSQRGRRTLVVWVVCKTLRKRHRPWHDFGAYAVHNEQAATHVE
ncbi:unnamed protein product [Prunus armeniaca]